MKLTGTLALDWSGHCVFTGTNDRGERLTEKSLDDLLRTLMRKSGCASGAVVNVELELLIREPNYPGTMEIGLS